MHLKRTFLWCQWYKSFWENVKKKAYHRWNTFLYTVLQWWSNSVSSGQGWHGIHNLKVDWRAWQMGIRNGVMSIGGLPEHQILNDRGNIRRCVTYKYRMIIQFLGIFLSRIKLLYNTIIININTYSSRFDQLRIW